MKFIDVALKGLIQTIRDKRGLLLLIVLPITLIIMFNFGFGGGTISSGSLPHEIAVINNDAGVAVTVNNTTKYVNYGTNFITVLENATAENSTTNLFHLNNVSEGKADDLLKSSGIDALVVIPNNFSMAITTMVNNTTRTAISSSLGLQSLASNSTAGTPSVVVAPVNLPQAGNTSSNLIIEGDITSNTFGSTQKYITAVFDGYKNSVRENAVASAAPGTGSNIFTDYVPVETVSVTGTELSQFDVMVPGLIVFLILFQASVITSSLVRDVELGTMDRLKLSKVRAFDLLTGTFLRWTLVIVGQIIILLVVAIALGYNYQGDFGTLGLAVLIGVIAGMATISLALLLASFVNNDMQAISVGAMIAVPVGFLAGALIPLPQQLLGEFGGHRYQVNELLPWTHAVYALRSLLTFGSGLNGDVIFDMYWLIILTMILFVIAVVTYSRTRLRAET